jgi:DNA-binding NarL/FixJ family response regulator
MGAMEPIRVVLVEDHELFRAGLRELLNGEDIEVVGEAADGERAIDEIVAKAPDVVVMDVHLPGKPGPEVTREVRRRSPSSRVLMLSVSEGDDDIAEAIVAGACGYLLKDSAVEDIAEGVRAAMRGEAMLSARIAGKLLDRLQADESPAELPDSERSRATGRELEVLGLISAGRDAATIADDLGITREEMRNHVANVLAKIEVRERIRAAVLAVRRGTT